MTGTIGRAVLATALCAAPAAAQWQTIEPAGETRCSDGSPYRFFVHPGDPQKLLVEFEGGGACWDDASCALPIFARTIQMDPETARQQGRLTGIYDRANPANPVKDFTHVYIPYCTGDLHWGAATRQYATVVGPYTIEHRGAINASAALDWAFENVPAPAQVLVAGCSAGGYGSIFWAPRILARYPAAAAAQLGDSAAGVVPPGFFAIPFANWNLAATWPADVPGLEPALQDPGAVTMAHLYTAVATHHPGAAFSQFNFTADSTQVFFWSLTRGSEGAPSEWSAHMTASLAALRDTNPNFFSYVAPGTQHCVINSPAFYTTAVSGIPLADWTARLLETRAPGSVP